jgi:hypothetical protein
MPASEDLAASIRGEVPQLTAASSTVEITQLPHKRSDFIHLLVLERRLEVF